MSTRCNVVVTFGRTRIFLYRHCDGHPAETGADLVNELRNEAAYFGGANPSRLVQALLSARYEKQKYESVPKPTYELTTEIHDDVTYVYAIRFEDTNRKRHPRVTCMKFEPGTERREPFDGEREGLDQLIQRVNADRVAINARMDDRGVTGARYAMLPNAKEHE